jgi:iron-sulfur cluster repair protein YtfE (RIC family)
LASIGAAWTLLAIGVLVRRQRIRARDNATRADVGFMRAMHDAFRRDLNRLEALVPRLASMAAAPPEIHEGWNEFRNELVRHHDAEDDDLWPVLRGRLNAAADLHEIDLMVDEHRQLQPAIDAVDDALAHGADLSAPVDRLGTLLEQHLDHEESTIFPLLERHMSRREWRMFLLTERRRTPLRQRPRFLTWVLDEANERDTAAVMAELPPPGRVVYRRLLQPRYAAKHRWQLEEPAMSRAS